MWSLGCNAGGWTLGLRPAPALWQKPGHVVPPPVPRHLLCMQEGSSRGVGGLKPISWWGVGMGTASSAGPSPPACWGVVHGETFGEGSTDSLCRQGRMGGRNHLFLQGTLKAADCPCDGPHPVVLAGGSPKPCMHSAAVPRPCLAGPGVGAAPLCGTGANVGAAQTPRASRRC